MGYRQCHLLLLSRWKLLSRWEVFQHHLITTPMDTAGHTYTLLSAGFALIGTSLRVSNSQDALVGATLLEGWSVVFSTMWVWDIFKFCLLTANFSRCRLSIRESGSSDPFGLLRPTLGLVLDVFWSYSVSLCTLRRPVLFPKPGILRSSISGVFGVLGVMLKLRKTPACKIATRIFDIAALLCSLRWVAPFINIFVLTARIYF